MPVNIYAIIGAASLALVVAVSGFFLYRAWSKREKLEEFERRLEDALKDDFIGDDTSGGSSSKWSNYWYRAFSSAGIDRYHRNPRKAGREMLLAGLSSGLIVGALTLNPFMGIIGAAGFMGVVSVLLQGKMDRESRRLAEQLPGFLFVLKANVQSGRTPDQALISLADAMPNPLKNEISGARTMLLAGATFEEAMESLASRTTSLELEDLANYMIIASRNGTSLIGAIETIQGILVNKEKIEQEKNRALSTTRLDRITSVLAIPLLFVGMYLASEDSRSFWFTSTTSWAIFGLVVLLYVGGIAITRGSLKSLTSKQRR